MKYSEFEKLIDDTILKPKKLHNAGFTYSMGGKFEIFSDDEQNEDLDMGDWECKNINFDTVLAKGPSIFHGRDGKLSKIYEDPTLRDLIVETARGIARSNKKWGGCDHRFLESFGVEVVEGVNVISPHMGS